MNEEQQKIIDELRTEGYAIAIFYPDETKGVSIKHLENSMCEAGEFYISTTEKDEEL